MATDKQPDSRDNSTLDRFMSARRPLVTPRATALELEGLSQPERPADGRGRGLLEVPIDAIRVPQWQPRTFYEERALLSLVESIRAHGVLEPVLVRRMPDAPMHFQLLAGSRRCRAARLAGLTMVPAIALDVDDNEARRVAILENLQRQDLNPWEQTAAILDLLMLHLEIERGALLALLYRLYNARLRGVAIEGKDEGVLDDIEKLLRQVADLSLASFVKHRLPILKWPNDLLQVLMQGQLEYSKVALIKAVQDPEQRQFVLQQAIRDNLSRSQIRELVKRIGQTEHETEPSYGDRLKLIARKIKQNQSRFDSKKQQRLKKLIREIEELIDE